MKRQQSAAQTLTEHETNAESSLSLNVIIKFRHQTVIPITALRQHQFRVQD